MIVWLRKVLKKAVLITEVSTILTEVEQLVEYRQLLLFSDRSLFSATKNGDINNHNHRIDWGTLLNALPTVRTTINE